MRQLTIMYVLMSAMTPVSDAGSYDIFDMDCRFEVVCAAKQIDSKICKCIENQARIFFPDPAMRGLALAFGMGDKKTIKDGMSILSSNSFESGLTREESVEEYVKLKSTHDMFQYSAIQKCGIQY